MSLSSRKEPTTGLGAAKLMVKNHFTSWERIYISEDPFWNLDAHDGASPKITENKKSMQVILHGAA